MTGASPTKRSLGQRLAAYLALLAIAAQCLIIQPHVEPTAIIALRAAASDVAGSSFIDRATVSAAHHAVDCAVCQAALSGGRGVAPAAPVAPIEQAGLPITAPRPEQPPLSATPSHAWQSRGPPQLI